jgi:hypothetical protein
MDIDKDLGYYVCNDIEFSSKINACIYSQTVNKPINWIFKNHIHDNFPWEIEPEGTLDQIYDRRCRELREKYDYIILSYSGGSDTNNILESFMRQNLHIDEIVTNHITEATEKMTVMNPLIKDPWNFNAEHQLQAVPRLREIYNKLPHTRITVLDVSKAIITSLDGKEEDWILSRREGLSPGMVFRYNHFYFSEVSKQFDKNLKICILVGIEKPRTHIQNGNFYVRFADSAANMSSIVDHNEHPNAKVEYFYWNDPVIVAKQAHVIKRWLEATPKMQRRWQNVTFETYRKYHEPLLKNIIYSNWRDDWFQTEKAIGIWHCEFDQWFHVSMKNTKNYTVWKKGVDYLTKTIPNYINYRNGYADGLKTLSHTYKIGEMKKIVL